jgi:hypothetical protein
MRKRLVVASFVVLLTAVLVFTGERLIPSFNPSPAESSIRPAPANGTISGRLLAVGGPCCLAPRPLAGSVSIGRQIDRNAPVVWSHVLAVDADGRYRISLPPGMYVVDGHSPQYDAGRTPCVARTMVAVSVGWDVVANVLCQEK